MIGSNLSLYQMEPRQSRRESHHAPRKTASSKPKRPEGRKFRQYVAALSATIGSFAVGTILAWTSPVLPLLEPESPIILSTPVNAALSPMNASFENFNDSDSTAASMIVDNLTHIPNHHWLTITKDEGSWVGSLIAIGACFGSVPGGKAADFFGRKPTVAFLAVPTIMSWLMILWANHVYWLYAARLLGGAVIGAVTATVPMYIGETAEVSIRGALGSYIQLMVVSGILYTYVIGSIYEDYTFICLACLIIPVLNLIIFLIVAPETPVYLLSRKRRKDAEKSLIILRGPDYDIQGELDELQKELDIQSQKKTSLVELYSNKATVKATIVIVGLLCFLSFSGINVVIFYLKRILKATGSKTITPNNGQNIVGLIQVIMTFFSSLLVDRAGRRPLLLISDVCMAVCIGSLAYYFYLKELGDEYVEGLGLLPVASLAVYIIVFSVGFGPIPGVMMGELFTPDVKGLALGIICILGSLIEFVVVKTFDDFEKWFGSGVAFGLFAIYCLIGTVFVYFVVPETKNKSLQQIQDELSGVKKRKGKRQGSTSRKSVKSNNSNHSRPPPVLGSKNNNIV
uniref:Facilitated trehalose transporter Tret1-2 homolog n=1 Tax=Cacopsylla melanoneura TaxID=428564 RepID=A0A8D8UHA4_9HEMI